MKKHIVFIMIVLLNISCSKHENAFVMSNNVNIRQAPNANSTIITQIGFNNKVSVLSKEDKEWTFIEYSKIKGFISSKYLIGEGEKIDYDNNEFSCELKENVIKIYSQSAKKTIISNIINLKKTFSSTDYFGMKENIKIQLIGFPYMLVQMNNSGDVGTFYLGLYNIYSKEFIDDLAAYRVRTGSVLGLSPSKKFIAFDAEVGLGGGKVLIYDLSKGKIVFESSYTDFNEEWTENDKFNFYTSEINLDKSKLPKIKDEREGRGYCQKVIWDNGNVIYADVVKEKVFN